MYWGTPDPPMKSVCAGNRICWRSRTQARDSRARYVVPPNPAALMAHRDDTGCRGKSAPLPSVVRSGRRGHHPARPRPGRGGRSPRHLRIGGATWRGTTMAMTSAPWPCGGQARAWRRGWPIMTPRHLSELEKGEQRRAWLRGPVGRAAVRHGGYGLSDKDGVPVQRESVKAAGVASVRVRASWPSRRSVTRPGLVSISRAGALVTWWKDSLG